MGGFGSDRHWQRSVAFIVGNAALVNERIAERDYIMAKYDKIGGIVLLIFFSLGLYIAFSFPEKAAYFPYLITGLGILLSLLMILRGFRGKKMGTAEELPKLSNKAVKSIAFMGAAILFYGIGIQYIGFCVSTFIFMMVTGIKLYQGNIRTAGKKPRLSILLSAVVVTAAIYIVFKLLLYVPLPSGLLI